MFSRLVVTALFLLCSATFAVDPARQTVADGRETFPTFGVSLIPPEGWARGPEEPAYGQIARWGKSADAASVKPGEPNLLAMLTVGFEPVVNRTLEQCAKRYAEHGGTIAEDATDLDDSRALRVIVPGSKKLLERSEMLISQHGQFFYCLNLTTVGGQSLAKDLEAIRVSWKWVPVEDPSTHLEFRERAQSLFNGMLFIYTPVIARQMPVADPTHDRHFAIFNVKRSDVDFLAHVQWIRIPRDVKLSTTLPGFSKQLGEQIRFDQPLVWDGDPKLPGHFHTQFVQAIIPSPGIEPKRMIAQWAMADLGDGNIAMLNFTIPPEVDEGRRSAYMEVAAKMLASVRRGPRVPPSPAR